MRLGVVAGEDDKDDAREGERKVNGSGDTVDDESEEGEEADSCEEADEKSRDRWDGELQESSLGGRTMGGGASKFHWEMTPTICLNRCKLKIEYTNNGKK